MLPCGPKPARVIKSTKQELDLENIRMKQPVTEECKQTVKQQFAEVITSKVLPCAGWDSHQNFDHDTQRAGAIVIVIEVLEHCLSMGLCHTLLQRL